MVVTNGYFTEQALVLARANGVRMRHRDDLAREIAALRGSATQRRPDSANATTSPIGSQERLA